MTAGSPTVSVLIKAYNHAPYVRRAIESVLEQSLQDFEIVATDDASTDNTAEIMRGFTDRRIDLVVNARNLGISGAMNATVARARGRYLAILNSDDWALPGRLRRQVDFLEAHPGVSAVFGLPRVVDEQGEPTVAHNDFAAATRLPDFSRRSWLRQFFFAGNCLCSPTAMIRREGYAVAGAYDRRLTNLQDLDMWIRMLIAGHTFHVIPEQLTALRIRANHANMSAPRVDSILRSKFEATKLLRHYANFDQALFDEVFGGDAGDVTMPGDSVAQRVAALALRDPRIEYQRFALEVFHATARTDDDFDRLRVLSGAIDGMGARMIQELCATLTAQEAELARLRAEPDRPDGDRLPPRHGWPGAGDP
jgi:glycosyltransferase involved in cell wall biosynthesis